MKIAINLLPIEFTQAEVKRAKFIKIQTIGVAAILLMVFLSSLSVTLRILQSQNIKSVQTQVSASEQKISNLKDKQISLLLIKNRLAVINQYLGNSSKQTAMFILLERLIPSSISINSAIIGKSGDISILALIPDSLTLDNMINNLTDKTQNEGQIRQVSIDSVSRGKDGVYRVSLNIKPS